MSLSTGEALVEEWQLALLLGELGVGGQQQTVAEVLRELTMAELELVMTNLAERIDAALPHWRPIETAPPASDSSARARSAGVLVFDPALGPVVAHQYADGTWGETTCGEVMPQPTHWMPCPTDPKD